MGSETNWISIFVVAGALVAMMGVIMTMMMWLFLRDRSKSQYDEYRNQAILSEMRASYEAQLARLNMQMTATEQRWRDANHLLLSAQQAQPEQVRPQKVILSPFLRELGLTEEEVAIDDKLIFVLTPFNDEEYPVFNLIKDLCSRIGFRCIRGDEDYSTDILAHIIKMIVRARVVIANVSSRNANVFYELGISHAVGKTTILVAKTVDDVPFDIKTKRIVLYTDLVDLDSRLRDQLLRALADATV